MASSCAKSTGFVAKSCTALWLTGEDLPCVLRAAYEIVILTLYKQAKILFYVLCFKCLSCTNFTCPCLLKVARLAVMEPLMISLVAPVKTGQRK